MSKPKVFIGVGHGGIDSGAVGCNGVEKEKCLIVATEIKRILNENGIRCKRSRKSNKIHDTVREEVVECNEYNPVCTVEIHFNASASHTGHGYEMWVTSTRGKVLATYLMNKMKGFNITNRGIKQTNSLYYLNHTNAPAVLVECAFIDNELDKEACTEAGCKNIASRISRGIIEYIEKEM